MSAWYVLSALGFYPVTPGQEIYAIGAPLFPEASIDVGGGRRFVIRARNVSSENMYIRSATLNGKPYGRSYLRHGDLVAGGELVFEMGPEPERRWGSARSERPGSAITEHLILPAPYVASGERLFRGSTEVALASPVEGARIHYTIGGERAAGRTHPAEPAADSAVYTGPFELNESAVVRARAFKNGYRPGGAIEVHFRRIPDGMDISLGTSYSPMYAAGGDLALIDGVRGPANFRTGAWQGYRGVDIEAVVDLGSVRSVHRLSTGFLFDSGAWILLPVEVEYAVSIDGEAFDIIAAIPSTAGRERGDVRIEHFTAGDIGRRARYVRMRARTAGVLPGWHHSAGSKAWLFADEIVIE